MTATKTTLKTKLAAILAAVMIAFGMAFVAGTAWAEGSDVQTADAVCSVTVDGNAKHFTTIEDAFESLGTIADGKEAEINVYKNYTNEALEKTLEIPQGKVVTLSIDIEVTLNLKKGTSCVLKNSGVLEISGGTFVGKIENYNTLNINGGTYTKTIKNKKTGVLEIYDGQFTDTVSNSSKGTLKIYGGTYTGHPDGGVWTYTCCISNSGNLEISNSTIGEGDNCADRGIDNTGKVTITDTHITGDLYAIYSMWSGGSVHIKGNSSLSSKSDCTIYANKSSVELSGGTIINDALDGYGVLVEGSNVTISSGEINACRGVTLFTYKDIPSKLEMTGGTINSEGIGISGSNPKSPGTEIAISGGTINSPGGTGVYLPMKCAFTMTGGTITGATGIEAKLGDIIISGTAKVKGTGNYVPNTEMVINNQGSNPDGSAILLAPRYYTEKNPDNLNLTITGGEISSTKGAAISVYNQKETPGTHNTVRLENGIYNGKIASLKYYVKETKTSPNEEAESNTVDPDVIINTTGGSYSHDVSNFCDKGHISIKEGADAKSFTVVEGKAGSDLEDHIAVAKIGNKYYGSVGAAINALRKPPSKA
ncbi:hypothetical protein [Xiamenia xianingshaonis]|uniref:Uncharacterized protein n=1 Tax=Xiamenia xianingshaonis TaxID=2682776 RepID=A0ABX0II66_9ACTN|nr:hypothetical protein [Xiamenia xianingshaonis]NHM13491.1 hypothetical protein [Xiamenia xianingshaonis]